MMTDCLSGNFVCGDIWGVTGDCCAPFYWLLCSDMWRRITTTGGKLKWAPGRHRVTASVGRRVWCSGILLILTSWEALVSVFGSNDLLVVGGVFWCSCFASFVPTAAGAWTIILGAVIGPTMAKTRKRRSVAAVSQWMHPWYSIGTKA